MQNSGMRKVICGMDAAIGLGLRCRVNPNSIANPSCRSVYSTYYFLYSALCILQDTPDMTLIFISSMGYWDDKFKGISDIDSC